MTVATRHGAEFRPLTLQALYRQNRKKHLISVDKIKMEPS